MKQETNNEQPLIQYLLGQMSPEEQARIEEQYLADPNFHQELRATERDLIDQYVHGELSDPKQFEKYFLSSPRRRQRVEFARALMQSLAQAPAVAESQERPSWWASLLRLPSGHHRAWLAVAATLIILVGGWLIVSRQKQNPLNQLGQQQPQQGSPEPPAPQPKPQTTPQPEVAQVQPRESTTSVPVITFILTPSLVRDTDETRTLAIEGNVQVSLQLHLEADDYKSYRARLRTAEGDEIWSQDQLKSRPTSSGQAIMVQLLASRFSSRDYTIKLSGVTAEGEVEEVSSYYFRVKKR